jgi:rRNA maturation RNase YbeY
MMYQASIRRDHACEVPDDVLILTAEKTLVAEKARPGAVTIVLTDENIIQDLNRRFADHDAPTDVLAFPDGSKDPDTGETYYGDVVVAVPIAQAQANAASHPLEPELVLLIVHGILHLLGYDHSNPDELKHMEARQAIILTDLGYPVTIMESDPSSTSRRSISRAAAFRHAFRGWGHVLRTQPNAWIHSVATILVVMLGIWLQIEARDWALLVLAIGLVWFAELLNTSLEAVVDIASPASHPLAQIGKDVGAAAVLIASLTALFIGLLILGPPLLRRIPIF